MSVDKVFFCSLLHKRMMNQDRDSIRSSSSSMELASKSSPNYLALFLHVCKILDVCLALPAHVLPQFRMFSWGFVSEGSSHLQQNGFDTHNGDDASSPSPSLVHADTTSLDFLPHVVRVSKLVLKRV